MSQTVPRILLAADWGKHAAKRAVYKADVARRSIHRVVQPEWSLGQLLTTAAAEVNENRAPVLVSLDLVLGIPRPYFHSLQSIERWNKATNFIDWLSLLTEETDFWKETKRGDEWKIERPFCGIPKGKGALKKFYETAGYDLLRSIDKTCFSKSPFVVNGIPGSVGSGTRCLWQELAPLLNAGREFRVWPFDGSLAELLENRRIVLAENYPGISYTSALAASLPSRQIMVSKTKGRSRTLALKQLNRAKWVAAAKVTLPDLAPAEASEDEFDALLTAAGQLRCVLEGIPLEDAARTDRVAEGGILLTSAVDFDQPRVNPFR